MKVEEIRVYCREKWKGCEDDPFGEIPICYRLNKKIFAQIYPKPEDYKITLKCTADAGQFYRQVYPGIVVRGYHCPSVQQPYWNTIYLQDFPEKELLNMIDHAYDTVLHSFSKKVQKEILTVEEIQVRPIKEEEYPLLEAFLYDAIFQQEGAKPLPREVIRQPELAVYVQDFGKPDDRCLVAESRGKVLGAVWTRIFSGEVKGYGNMDASTPELAVSVKKEFRHQGIGRRLMQEMIGVLKNSGYGKVSLSVNKENPAYRLYESLGFQTAEEQGEDVLMFLAWQAGTEQK